MSSSDQSKALARKADDNMQLMPPPPLKRIKRPPKIIPEDDYTDALSEIIARDFFPGLLESKHQQDYLDALDSQDSEWIAEASRRLTEVMTTPQHRRRGTSFATPIFRNASATPQHNSGAATPSAGPPEAERKANIDTSLSLDAFLEKYTSEDNASFNDILDKQNEKRRNAYAFFWNNNKIPGFRQQAHQKRLKAQEEEKERLGPDGQVKMIKLPDERKAVPNTWNSEPRNGLMFIPDRSPPPPERKEGEKELPPKAIAYSNTRMPPPAIPNPSKSSSVAPTVIQDAIAGRPRPSDSEPGFGVAATPRVNGYSFVDDAPSPSPSELGAPPLTWGNVASISSTDEPSSSTPTTSPFKIAATPRRELLHHRMVEKVAKGKRAQTNQLLSTARTPGAARTPTTGTPRMTPLGGGGKGREIPKFGSASPALTPAGARLWGNLQARKETGLRESLAKGPAATGQAGAGGRGFRWTPTPVAGKK